MTLLARITTLVAAIWCSGATAQVVVRAGEHGTFTRLVFYLDSPVADWRALKTAKGITIAPINAPVTPDFDWSSVFDFIPRVRVTDLQPGPSGLSIVADCVCDITAFPYRDDVLVIDLSDAEPGAAPVFSGLTVSEEGLTQSLQRPSGQRMTSSAPMLPRASPRHFPSIVPFAARTAEGQSVASGAILRGLSENIANGLLSPEPRRKTATVLIHSAAGIELSSALRPRSDPGSETPQVSCPIEGETDLPIVNGEGAASTAGVTLARNRLASAVPEEAESAALALTRAYLALGFGAEARQVLDAFAAENDAARFLRPITQIVDMPSDPEPNYPTNHVTCDGMPAIWALLASPPAQLSRYSLDPKALLRTLSGLEPLMRRHLAPHVAQKLSALELAEDASMAMAAVERANGLPDGKVGAESQHGSKARHANADGDAKAGWNSNIAAAHFGPEVWSALHDTALDLPDRILIEAAIKDAPDRASQLDGITRYVSRLAQLDKPVVALSYLDQLIEERVVDTSSLTPALDTALGAVTVQASDGEVLAVSASLEGRDWFKEADLGGKAQFLDRSARLKRALGLADSTAPETAREPPSPEPLVVAADTDGPEATIASNPKSALATLLDSSESAVAEADALEARLETLLENW